MITHNPVLDGILPVLFLVLVVAGIPSRAGRTKKSPRRQRANLKWAIFIASAVAAVAAAGLISAFSDRLPVSLLIMNAAIVIFPLVCYLRPYTRSEMIRNYLHEPHRCGRCEYDLTGNISGICPECGWPIPRDIKQVELQDDEWQIWGKRWQIEYLDNPHGLLAAQAVAIAAGLTAASLCAMYRSWVFGGSFAVLAVGYGLNLARILQYLQRQRTARQVKNHHLQ